MTRTATLAADVPVLNEIAPLGAGFAMSRRFEFGALGVNRRDSEFYRDTIALLRVDTLAQVTDTLAFVPGMTIAVSGSGDDAQVHMPILSRTLAFAAHDTLLYVSDQSRFEVRTYTTETGLSRVLRADVPAARRAVDTLPASLREKSPETPANGALLTDAGGNLWVQDAAPLGRIARGWTVFSPRGEPLGRVELPARTRLLDARQDWLLAVHEDELGVERVVILRMESASPRERQ